LHSGAGFRAVRWREARVQRRAPHIDGGDPESVAGPGLFEKALDGFRRSRAVLAHLARRGIDEQHDIDRSGGLLRRRGPETDGHDGRGKVAPPEALGERDRGRINGMRHCWRACHGGKRREQD
jgi:hypothetical protein